MRSLGVVDDEVLVEGRLDLFDGLVPGPAAFDAEVLVEEGSVNPFDETIALRASDLGGAVLDAFELKEELVGMSVGSSAELASVVAEDGVDLGLVLFEERQDVFVEDVDGGNGQLAGVQACPGVAGVTC